MTLRSKFVAFSLKALTCSIIVSPLLFSGCPQREASNNDTPDSPKVAAAESQFETTSVQPTKTSSNQTSPAANAVTNNPSPADATPEEVCRSFMSLLQSGKQIAAEDLLTRTALTTTTKAELKLEPMGGPQATYLFGETSYATNRQKLAQVPCTVTDQVDGEEYSIDITWLVRKRNMGWRISGVILALEPGEVPNLLSFENIKDVEILKSEAAEEILNESETRQASAASDLTTPRRE